MAEADPALDARLRAAFGALDVTDLLEAPPPPAGTWNVIASALAAEGEGTRISNDGAVHDTPTIDLRASSDTAGIEADRDTDDLARARYRRNQRARRSIAVIAVAAAMVVVLVLGGRFVRNDPENVIESAALTDAGLPTRSDVQGRAELMTDGGRTLLDVQLADLPAAAPGQVYEVWLLASDKSGLQSLGLIEQSGRFVVPPGVDTSRFNIVDVSREPVNGDPSHSGDSIVRGTLA